MTNRARDLKTETCADAYHRTATEAGAKLRELTKRLGRHHAAAGLAPTNWGLVGDLGRLNEVLDEALEALS